MQAQGATLLAISPQTPDNSLTIAEKNGLKFEVLSDVGNTVARKFGLAFRLVDELQAAMSTICLLYTSPSPRDLSTSRMPSSA